MSDEPKPGGAVRAAADLHCPCPSCRRPLPAIDRKDFTGERIVQHVVQLLERAAVESDHLGLPALAAAHRLRAVDLQSSLGGDERLRARIGE